MAPPIFNNIKLETKAMKIQVETPVMDMQGKRDEEDARYFTRIIGDLPYGAKMRVYAADLSNLDFSEMDLCEIHFSKCKLNKTLFRATDLRRSSFFGCELIGCDFTNAKMPAEKNIFICCTR